MGHPQPKTPMQTDNSAAHQVVTNNVQPKRTKAMDMRFHWLRDRAAQKQFRYYWRPGPTNLGDYHTKHHPGSHHQNMRPEFVTPRRVLEDLRMHRESRSWARHKFQKLRYRRGQLQQLQPKWTVLFITPRGCARIFVCRFLGGCTSTWNLPKSCEIWVIKTRHSWPLACIQMQATTNSHQASTHRQQQ